MTNTKTYGFWIAELEGGQVLAISESEPLFCLPAKTADEAVALAQETFVEYFARFHNKEAPVRVKPLNPIPAWVIEQGNAYGVECP